MAFAHLDWNRRLLIIGALAGVVMEAALAAAFFVPKGILPPIEGLSATQHRSLELLPFVLVGGAALLVGLGAFAGSAILTARRTRRKRRTKRLAPRAR